MSVCGDIYFSQVDDILRDIIQTIFFFPFLTRLYVSSKKSVFSSFFEQAIGVCTCLVRFVFKVLRL